MKILIQGKQLQLSDEIRSYVADRLVRPLARIYDDPAAELRVELGDMNGPHKGGNDKECSLTLRIPGANTIRIEERTRDSYASLDSASDRMMEACKRELDRTRRRKGHHKYRPLATVVAEGGVPGGPIEELPDARAISTASLDAQKTHDRPRKRSRR